jgi:hypothetical protein
MLHLLSVRIRGRVQQIVGSSYAYRSSDSCRFGYHRNADVSQRGVRRFVLLLFRILIVTIIVMDNNVWLSRLIATVHVLSCLLNAVELSVDLQC